MHCVSYKPQDIQLKQMLYKSRESQRLFPLEKSLSRSHSSPQYRNKLVYFSSCEKSTRCILISLLLAEVSQETVGGISTTTAEPAFFVRDVAKQYDVVLTYACFSEQYNLATTLATW